ncbi:baseplate J/gp47 family protein [Pseudomonas sp. NPDC090755]|uniref:baseplate J/gp47 family protein n=1 Tax=Pseudomonas sp. NPDC090755 TaxID=3364481 RepID=UPI003839EFC4
MPFETPTLPALISRVQADLGSNALRHSDAQVLARALSAAAYGLYGYLDWVAEQILPDSADEETLERMAAIRLSAPRKPAQPATGPVGFTAAAGAPLDANTVLQASDGRSYRVTVDVFTVAGANTATVEALDGGPLGNAEAGLSLNLVQPVEGIASAFTVLAPGLVGGIAQENLEALRGRVIRSYRVIPHGGSADDYETWALECPGITRAWCRGNYLGSGTIALFVMRDNDEDPIPNPEQLVAVKAYVEVRRPVTAELYVFAPVPVPVVYSVRLKPDSTAVRASVEAQLLDLHAREAGLGDTLLISHIRETISGANGEHDHVLVSPAADVVPAANQLLTYGGCVWLP